MYFLACTIPGLFLIGFRLPLRSRSNNFLSPFGCTHPRVLQDDDRLILPEVIQTLHARVTEHVLPHEHLSSDLRLVYAGSNAAGDMMHRFRV